MPEITFQQWTGIPSIALIESDYFFQSSPPDLPDIPDLSEIEGFDVGGIQRRAQEAVDKIIGNVGDAQYVPTILDLNGADLGVRFGRIVAAQNRIAMRDDTFYDICLVLMDGDETHPGFMGVYNEVVQKYARALFVTVPSFFSTDPIGRNAALAAVFRSSRNHLNGLLRSTQAALRGAYTIATTNSDLDIGNVETITREGKIPADFL